MLNSTGVKFILLKNLKMPTYVGILTFISRINTTSEYFKQQKVFIFQYFSFYQAVENSCTVELSMKKFNNLGA